MLVPALLYKEQIEKEFTKALYTDDFFFYQGWDCGSIVPEIRKEKNLYQYAIIDKNDNLLGFLSYMTEPSAQTAWGFGAYSFDKGNYQVGRDLKTKACELVQRYRRIEWRAIEGNPAIRSYDRFLKMHQKIPYIEAYRHVLHNTTIDNYGNYKNEIIYEIINRGNC